MRIGVFLGHPAHFYMLKNSVLQWQNDGHNVFFAVKKKDILESLIKGAGYSYTVIREGRKNSKFGMILSVLEMERRMCSFLKKNKIDILIGTTLSFASRVIMRTPVVVMCEDDADVVPLYANISYPWASAILNPISCNAGKWERKAIKYASYQKMAYLHPNRFSPSAEIVRQYGINIDEPYFLIRFVNHMAHHDNKADGIDYRFAESIINMLRPYGRIFISSESPLNNKLDEYSLQINPLDIHHVMAFADMFISDSQSMSIEAALLGVPSVRCSDFAGRISVLEELEKNYQLTFGFKSNQVDKIFSKINELISLPNSREIFQQRRQIMLRDKIDFSAFLTWFVENYPQSDEIMRKDPYYQYRFK